MKAVIPSMLKQKKGAIINNTSDQAIIGKPRTAIYGPSKAALAQLTKSAALDWAQYNIRINAIAPTSTDTPMLRQVIRELPERYPEQYSTDLETLLKSNINTNLNGTYYLCKYVLPYLPDKQGRIINISSVLGLKGVPDQIAYCSAKHGVIGLTRSLALYVAPRGITVNAICPGWVDTDMAHARFHELNLTREQVENAVPLGKITNPEEIAALAYYLASPVASNVTGQTITIDGGSIL